MKTYLRKKTINCREYFYDMTPYWDREKKKTRYHSKYLGIQKENGIETMRTHLPGNIFVYGPFIPVLRIIRELGIESILDSLFRKEDRNTHAIFLTAYITSSGRYREQQHS